MLFFAKKDKGLDVVDFMVTFTMTDPFTNEDFNFKVSPDVYIAAVEGIVFIFFTSNSFFF